MILTKVALLWRLLNRNRLAAAGVYMVSFLILIAVFAPLLAPHDAVEQNLSRSCKGPSLEYLLGTDEFGRCILSRILYGSRISLTIGVTSIGMALLVGVFLGLIAGYYGGIVDGLIMRVVDVMLAFPYFLLAIAIVILLGPGIFNLIITISIYSIPTFARVIRGLVLSQKQREYIEAARAFGENDSNIIFRYLLPNCIPSIIVYSTLRIGSAILVSSILGFLGLGIAPPTPEWGAMLSGGRAYLRAAPHIVIFPGIAIMIAVLGCNLIGDGLRDVLDPRLREEVLK
jgi:peptide/nickel transport system permease protein